MRRLSLGLFLMLAGTAPCLADWSATGRFLYVDREFDANGFTGVEPQLPIRFADVQVVEGSKILASGVTDAQGNFTIAVQDSRVRDIYVRCLARRQTSNGVPIEVRSGNQSGDIWSVRTQTFLGHAPNQNLFIGSLAAIPGAGGEAFNLYDVAVLGSEYLQFLRGGGSAPMLLVIFNAANPNLSSTSGNTITQARNAGYDDTVLLHEMGHYVVNNFSSSDNPGVVHHLSDCNQNIVVAFDEGHATFFGNSVRRHFNLPHSSTYVRTTGLAGPGNLQFSFDLETQLPFVCYGATSETTVYAALWDILDGASTTDESPGTEEPWDLIQAAPQDYFRVMTDYLPTAQNISLEDFWDGWFHPLIHNGRQPEMIGIFRTLGVEYFTDPFETNDSISEARALTPGPSLNHLTFFADRDGNLLGEPDTDVFRFEALTGATYTIETLNLLSDGNTALQLLATDGVTELASNDNRGINDPSSLISYTAAQAGRRYVLVTHSADFGVYGSYDLRIAIAGSGADGDGDGFTSDVDCNDGDPAIHPGAVEVCNAVDDDCDLTVDEGFDRDGDGYTSCAGDCNDFSPAIHPGVTEVCDSIDNDCDLAVDEGFDADGDGYSSCGGDCNDAAPQIHPNQPETCNGIDDNCNQMIDEEFDGDADGVTACGGDCNDANPAVFPGAAELCDGLDNDCDLAIDEGFVDTDADGLPNCRDPDDDNDGVPDGVDCAPLTYSMSQPPAEVLDTRLSPSGSATRITWGQVSQANVYNLYRGQVSLSAGWQFQTNCQLSEAAGSLFDELAAPAVGNLFYYLQAGTNLCGEGTVGTGTGGAQRPLAVPCSPQGRDTDHDLVLDLADNCPLAANAGQADGDRDGRGDTCDNCLAVYNPTQGDQDTNGLGDACQDGDQDGFMADVDCRDNNPAVHPGAAEVCNQIDDDCDATVDEGFGTGVACSVGQGACLRYGLIVCTANGSGNQCDAVPGTPQTEVCNLIDDDCDGPIDEDFDLDLDGYTTCGGDCADGAPGVHPGAVEIFNGVDDDCNNVIDDVVEVVTITRATFQASNSRLTVEATTNYPPGSVTLSVNGFGTMTYVSSGDLYRLTATTGTNPGSVTVMSTAGGSATSPVSPI
jgi:hypothetical protein